MLDNDCSPQLCSIIGGLLSSSDPGAHSLGDPGKLPHLDELQVLVYKISHGQLTKLRGFNSRSGTFSPNRLAVCDLGWVTEPCLSSFSHLKWKYAYATLQINVIMLGQCFLSWRTYLWSEGINRWWCRSLLANTYSEAVTSFPGDRPCKASSSPAHSTWLFPVSHSYRWGKAPRGCLLKRHYYLISLLIRVWPKNQRISLSIWQSFSSSL